MLDHSLDVLEFTTGGLSYILNKGLYKQEPINNVKFILINKPTEIPIVFT